MTVRDPDLIKRRLSKLLHSADCNPIDLPILLRADPFIETAGEDLRRRMFITSGSEGQELCLRPDFTIPVCMEHLDHNSKAQRYAYFGPVFRLRHANGPAETNEFLQAGVEDLGSDDNSANRDAQITALALRAARVCHGTAPLKLRLGDPSLFRALLAGLDLPDSLQRRILRSFQREKPLELILRHLYPETPRSLALPEKIFAALGAREELVHVISNQMVEHGLTGTAGRAPEHIADRLMDQYGDDARQLEEDLRTRAEGAISHYLEIIQDIREIPARLSELENAYDFKFGSASEAYSERLLQLMNLPELESLSHLQFSAAFARPMDYYTGFVFEIISIGTKPVAAGGRYDGLADILGSQHPVPAVGFSLWIDRLPLEGDPS